MDIKCSMQSTDHQPDYDSIILRDIDITNTLEQHSDDQDYDFLELGLQSTDELSAKKSVIVGGIEQVQNVGFNDKQESEPLYLPTSMEDFKVDASSNIELGDFLHRPIIIKEYTWTEGTTFDQDFNPWLEFFSHPTITPKIQYYYMTRCKLHLKFVINASPFYYSALMASYRPLSDIAGTGGFNPCPALSKSTSTQCNLIALSQRPRVFLYPQSSQGAEMELPFFYHQNWLDISDVEEMTRMGTINLCDLNFALDHANSVVGAGVDVKVYAWVTDLELAGATLQTQSSDEYGQGILSTPASAIARLAGSLNKHPIIGKYATATSLIAGTTSKVASLFGYTNVPNIDTVQSFKNKMLPSLATTDISTPIEKLTLDSKNELSIDNRLNGIDLGDELVVSSIVKREAYLGTYSWTAAQPANTLLFNSLVTPNLSLNVTAASVNYTQGVPMWMVAQLFQYWRGDITFRIKFLCTQYHRGRVKVAWDPVGSASATDESTNIIYTQIVDITEDNDIEFTVPYTQLTTYLQTYNEAISFGTSPLTSVPGYSNGTFTIRVLNAQTSPVASATIGMAIFVKGEDNLEFGAPKEFDKIYSKYIVQSQDILYETPKHIQLGNKPSNVNDNVNLVHMGETMKSLRQLMRRNVFNRTILFRTDLITSTYRYTVCTTRFSRMPLQPGYDPNGIHLASGTISLGPWPYNYVHMTHLDFINNCFIAHKGSINWTARITNNPKNADNTPITQSLMVRTLNPRTIAYYNQVNSTSVVSNSAVSRYAVEHIPSCSAGASATAVEITPTITCSVPNYNKYKFCTNDARTRTLGTDLDDSLIESVELKLASYIGSISVQTHIKTDMYCSIGTDFNSIFFLNVPFYTVLLLQPVTTA